MNRRLYTQQLDIIHAMLDKGHNSIMLGRHTLLLWSLSFGLLTGFSGLMLEHALPTALMHDPLIKKLVTIVFVTLAVGLVLFIDHIVTKQRTFRQDESFAPLQAKINSIIWLLIGSCVVLLVFSLLKIGHARVVYGIFIIVSGLCLYIYGLFSIAWLRWSGAIKILLGIFALFLLKHTELHIFTACVFLIGGTLIHFLTPVAENGKKYLRFSLLWVVVVFSATFVIGKVHYFLFINADHLEIVSLQQYRAHPRRDKVVVALPAGTQVLIDSETRFNAFDHPVRDQFSMRLATSLSIVIADGKPTGVYKIQGTRWLRYDETTSADKFRRIVQIDPAAGAIIMREVYIRSGQNRTRIF